MKLRQALHGCPTGLLRKIAAAHGLAVDVATLQAELVERLTTELARRAAEGKLWRGSTPDERTAVGLVAAAGGRHGAELLERRLAARLAASAARPAAEILAGLLERGALFRAFTAGGAARGAHYVLPEEYLEPAGTELLDAPPLGDPAFALEALEVRENDPRRDCFTLASALRREIWNLAGRRMAGKPPRSLEQVLARLRPATPDVRPSLARRRWRFFLRLGRRLGWLRGDGWPTPDDAAVLETLGEPSPPVERWWQASEEAGHRVSGPGPGGERSAALRRDALQLLAELAPGRWYRPAELHRAIGRELGLVDAAPAGSVGAAPRGPSLAELEGLDDWLAGAWFWLGLVCWGRDEAGWGLVATTAALAALRAEAAAPPAAPAAACRLGDDLRLLAPPSAELATLYRAEPYLAYLGGAGERVYVLTAPAFARGLRLGGSVAEASELLERLGQSPLPSAWSRALATWSEAAGRLRLEARLVLAAADAELLERVVDLPGVGAAIEERFSERHAAIAPAALVAVLEAAAAAGWPVEVGAGLRLEPGRPGGAVVLGGEASGLLWVLLEALRRLDPAVVERLAGAAAARDALEATIPPASRSALAGRAESLARRIAAGRRSGPPPGKGPG